MKKFITSHERKAVLVAAGNSQQSLKASKIKKPSYIRPQLHNFLRTNTELSVKA